MGRTITLVNHLNSEELKTHYQRSSDPVESRRWHLLWLVSQQWYLLDAASNSHYGNLAGVGRDI